MFPIVYHYRSSSEPFQLIHREQAFGDMAFKPSGLWVTPDDEHNWEYWCRCEEFALEKLAHRFRIKLRDDAKIRFIQNSAQLLAFQEEYSKPIHNGIGDLYLMNWKKLAAKYQGLLIIPYIWERRLDTMWYYTWDCSSGCIWDPAAIESIEHDETYVPRVDYP